MEERSQMVEKSVRRSLTFTLTSDHMKTKIMLLLGSVALITLSFTFATVKKPIETETTTVKVIHSEPIGGLFADEVVE
jgi:hypothetical protein